MAGELQPRVSSMRIALSTIDTSREPAHPRRVEKNPNITGPRAYWVPYDAAGPAARPLTECAVVHKPTQAARPMPVFEHAALSGAEVPIPLLRLPFIDAAGVAVPVRQETVA